MKKSIIFFTIALISLSIIISCQKEPVPVVSVGQQAGKLTAGVAGSVTFPVTAENIANGDHAATVTDLPVGVSVTGNVTINEGKGTLTLAGNSSTEAGTTSSLRLTIKDTQSATFTLTIDEPPVSGVTLNKTATTISAGETEILTATVLPPNAVNKNVTWSSNNTDRATVDATGKVAVPITATAGTAIITVTTVDGGKTATCTVTAIPAPVAVTGVTLNKTATTIVVGETETLTATVAPANATNKNVTWSSSNTARATVSTTGRVTVPTTATAGTVTITVKTDDGGKTATCTVTVIIDNNNSDWVLINGVKWATRNVGSPGKFVDNPEHYGNYYQWNKGTTDVLAFYFASNYWSSSIWRSDNDPSPAGYRVPKMEEIQSLTNSSYVTYEWTTRNGVWGGKFTDKTNGNSIFLPAAGNRSSSGSFFDRGIRGYYWTQNQVSSTNNRNAIFLHFYSGFVYWNNWTQKDEGNSVRPVKE